MSTFDTCYIKCQNPSRLLGYMHTICAAKCIDYFKVFKKVKFIYSIIYLFGSVLGIGSSKTQLCNI